MSRPFTDIGLAVAGSGIKNGSVVLSTTKTGSYQTLNTYTTNKPVISDIDNKYGYKFYNGIFVHTISTSGNA